MISPSATDTAIWDPHEPDTTAHLPSRHEMLRAEDIADAVLCGAGRTGTWTAIAQWGGRPDRLSLGKGIGGG